MPVKTTQEKFLHELADLYDAEHQFLQGQHHMHAQAKDAKLKAMIHEHIAESQQQIKNLEQVFSALGEKPKRQPVTVLRASWPRGVRPWRRRLASRCCATP